MLGFAPSLLPVPLFSTSGLDCCMVEIGGLGVSHQPGDVLATRPLGSGLAIAGYDPEIKTGGMLHILLPACQVAPERALAHPTLFLDTGVPALLKALAELGAQQDRLLFYAAGGASPFHPEAGFNLGQQNIQAWTHICQRLQLRVPAQKLGGFTNCSLNLRLANGEVWLKVAGQPNLTYLCKSSTIT